MAELTDDGECVCMCVRGCACMCVKQEVLVPSLDGEQDPLFRLLAPLPSRAPSTPLSYRASLLFKKMCF